MSLFGFLRRIFRFRRKRRGSSSSVTDKTFTSFLSWAASWAILAPRIPRIKPIVVAEKVVLFVKEVARQSDIDTKFLTAQIVTPEDLDQSDLVMFYIQQFPYCLSVFDRCEPKKENFVSLVSSSVKCNSPQLIMNSLVQTLFWQVWYYMKYAPHLDPELAMKENYDSFFTGAKILFESIR